MALVALSLAMLVPALSQPVAAAPTTYHVSPSGSGPDPGICETGGSEAAPWGDFEWALRCLHPGDTLLVHGSYEQPYIQDVVPVTRAGTATAPIHVKAAPGERPLLRGRLWLGSGTSKWDHWHFDGINVTHEPSIYTGLSTAEKNDRMLVKLRDGTNWSYRNAEVWGSPATAQVRVEGSDAHPSEPANWTLSGMCIHHALESQANKDNTTVDYMDHNVYVDTGPGTGPGTITRNIMFDAPHGKNLKLGPVAQNIRVSYNTFYDASENVLVNDQSRDIELERNLLVRAGENAGGLEWYPNLRGYRLEGDNVRAMENVGSDAGSGAPGFIFNWYPEQSRQNTGSGPGILAAGSNRGGASVTFNNTSSCSGFVPTSAAGTSVGRYAKFDRVAGQSRTATAVDASRFAFPDPSKVDAVLISRADKYPDALSGAPFAVKVGAPILLTGSDRLGDDAKAEVQRLDPTVAYLLGGTGALSPQVEFDLKAAGVGTVIRVAGDSRFSTAVEVAERVGGRQAVIVEGSNANPRRGWPDAVSVASFAASQGTPILLTVRDVLPDETRDALIDLGITEVTIVGGTAAVSADVEDEIADPDGDGIDEVTVTRIKGDSRYGTSAAVADTAVEAGADPSIIWLASGENWPDALAAGPVVAQYGGVFLLSHPFDLTESKETHAWIERHASGVDLGVLVGGSGAIHFLVEDQFATTIK